MCLSDIMGNYFLSVCHNTKHMKAKFINPQWNSKCALDPLNIDFVQIGSNCGTDSCANCGEPVWKDATHYGWKGTVVEPNPRVFEQLKQNYSPYKNVKAVRTAVCENTGTANLFVPNDYTTQISSLKKGHLSKHGSTNINTVQVPCLTLEDFWTQHVTPRHDKVDILDIDIEGMDHKIIHSTSFDKLSPQPTCVLYENAHIPDDEKQQTQRHLKQFGYTRFEPWRGCGRDDFDMLACKE